MSRYILKKSVYVHITENRTNRITAIITKAESSMFPLKKDNVLQMMPKHLINSLITLICFALNTITWRNVMFL